MLKLGEKIINQIYLGDKKIAKVFLGEKLVYQTLVQEPTFLDYIEFDGASYINTSIPMSGKQKCIVETKMQFSPSSVRQLQGFSTDAGGYWGVATNNVFELGGGIALSNTINPYEVNEINVEFTPTVTTITVDNTTISRNGGGFDRSKVYTIGSVISSSGYYMFGRVYYHRLSDENGLIQDLRPCIHPNGTVCFYDTVTNEYFYNQGTGELKAGGRFVESIYFDGNCYIDTGLKHETCRIETAVKYEAGHSRRMLTGWSGADSYWGMMSNGKMEVSGSGTNTAILTDYTEIEIILDNENLLFTVTADGETKTVPAVYTSYDKYTIGCSTPSSSNKIIGNVYYHRAYNATGDLIQDLRPYVDADGKAYFKDLVTGDLFYNKGTGTLEYTE